MVPLTQAIMDCRDHYLMTHAASSAKTWESHARILAKVWPDKTVGGLTRLEVQSWVAGCRKTLSPGTINHRLSFLRQTYELAIERGLTQSNPCHGVKRLRVDNAVHRDLSTSEEAQIRQGVTCTKAWSVIRFAVLTGLRRAEQFRLRVADLDMARAGIHVPSSKGSRRRWVALNPEALAIAKLWAKQGGPFLFYPKATGDRIKLGKQFCDRVFRRAVRGAEIQHARWHDLRHAFASRMVQKDVPLYVVQQLLGHTNPAMTQRYAHLQDAQFRDAVNKLT